MALAWIYLVNSILLILHEIDSAYWNEWKLFKLPGGITGFLLLHIPLLALLQIGLILVFSNDFAGLIISLLVSISGVFAFCIHTFFIARGHEEFRSAISQIILVATLLLSITQGTLTAILIIP